ncbi:hypothetical protein Tfer_0887 [Thermincola ferriacetica]|uniref:Uncharacterized protein n=1 Tax=Thermincola ferriacetica TaxID=281456 RepID=A0A0L6W420_9FIRM|nr:hypothetical protein [Thermincola ferriacetica]KNZ70327.1 hypothetical protein Tfer_0887 [Thermincola ferriacetica]
MKKRLSEVIDLSKVDDLEAAHALAWAALEKIFPERGRLMLDHLPNQADENDVPVYRRGELSICLDETDRCLATANPVVTAWVVAALAEAARVLGVVLYWEQPEDCSQGKNSLVHICGTRLESIPGAICPVCGYDTGVENCVVAEPGE